jgi:hypothetical protein
MPTLAQLLLSTGLLLVLTQIANAADPPTAAADAKPAAETPPTPLNPQQTVFLDRAGKRIILKAEVVLRGGLLEMLLCKKQTKEHESILSLDSEAYVIHAGLLTLGAEAGAPVQYTPEFKAPTGQQIEVRLRWKDAEGKEQTARAQDWVRTVTARYYASPLEKLPEGFTLPTETELRYDSMNKELLWFGPMTEEQRDTFLALSTNEQYQQGIRKFFDESQTRYMTADFVFAGSAFWVEPDGSKYYQAEAGNIICVANFGDALLDVSVPSSSSNEGLLFEPSTERIPPLGTIVEVDLLPVFTEEKDGDAVDKPAAP